MASIDTETPLHESGAFSGGEQRLTRIAVSLIDPDAPVQLHEDIPGLDREGLSLVLAAIAHANGSQEHSGLVTDDTGRTGFTRLDTAYAWPTT